MNPHTIKKNAVRCRLWRDKNKELLRERDRLKYQKNKEKIKQRSSDRYAVKKGEIDLKNRAYRRRRAAIQKKIKSKKTPAQIKARRLILIARSERLRRYKREYDRKRMAEDTSYKIKKHISLRIRNALRVVGRRKSLRTIEYLGCDIEFFKGYISAKFTGGMSWDNYGKWHLDHIIPCAHFDLTDIDQRRICFHYTNIQPMSAAENIRKGKTLPKPHQSIMI